MDEYPKAIYRAGSDIVWDGHSLDFDTVNSADEEAQALAAGWHLHYADMTEEKPRRGRPPKSA